MRRKSQILIFLVAAAVFGYLVLIDYPAALRAMTPELSSGAWEQIEDQSADESEDVSVIPDASAEENQPEQTESQETDTAVAAAQVLLFVGSIRETVYTELYPVLRDAGCTGTLFFFSGRLTGDYAQMTTEQFLELMDAGWGCAMGGVDSELSADEWRDALSDDLEKIEERAGVRPAVYCFQEGEYTQEREEILEGLGFTALYYTAEDAENAAADVSALKKAVWIPAAGGVSEETLEQALSYFTIAFGQIPDGDEGIPSSEDWSNLLSVLNEDERFTIVTQSEWIGTALEE